MALMDMVKRRMRVNGVEQIRAYLYHSRQEITEISK